MHNNRKTNYSTLTALLVVQILMHQALIQDLSVGYTYCTK